MYEWNRNIQKLVDSIEESLREGEGDEITLEKMAAKISYSPFHMTRHFKEITGMLFRDYLRYRRLAYSVIELRDSSLRILDIAIKYGFTSQEAYARAFKKAYQVTPKAYRRNPKPLLLRNKVNTFDPYYLGIGVNDMDKTKLQEIKIWIETIPAHKVLYIKNYESKGYWDFWEKQEKIPGCDCNTICGLLDSIKGKLDGDDNELGIFSGQLMLYPVEADGRIPEGYGVRVASDYDGEILPQLICTEVPEGEYIIFAHPTFEYPTMSEMVSKKVEETAATYSLGNTEYQYDETAGRIGYLYHSPEVWGYRIIKPVKKRS